MAQNEPYHRSRRSNVHGSRRQAENFIRYQAKRGITDTRTLYYDLMKRYGATPGVWAAIDKYNLGPDYWGSRSGPGSEETPAPPQVDPNTGVPPGEPAAPATPPAPGTPGYPVSGTPPGTSTSELTPRQALPAFVPNYQSFWNPSSTMGSQPTFTDPRYYFRGEDPYSGPINYGGGMGTGYQPPISPIQIGGRSFPNVNPMLGSMQTGYAPPQVMRQMIQPSAFRDDYSYGWDGPGMVTMPESAQKAGVDPYWFRVARQSPQYQGWYGGIRQAPTPSTNPMGGPTFGMDPQGSVGGGMLGMFKKGLGPRAFGGMLSRGYFS